MIIIQSWPSAVQTTFRRDRMYPVSAFLKLSEGTEKSPHLSKYLSRYFVPYPKQPVKIGIGRCCVGHTENKL